MEEQEEKTCPCCHKKKVRSEEDYTKLIHRLNRISAPVWHRIFERVTMKSLKNWLPHCKS